MRSKIDFDGLFQSRYVYQPHEGRLYRELTQPNEDLILERNKQRRNMNQRKMEWGRMVADIPHNAWEALCRKYPDLRARDREIREKALMSLLKSPEGAPFLVVDRSKV